MTYKKYALFALLDYQEINGMKSVYLVNGKSRFADGKA